MGQRALKRKKKHFWRGMSDIYLCATCRPSWFLPLYVGFMLISCWLQCHHVFHLPVDTSNMVTLIEAKFIIVFGVWKFLKMMISIQNYSFFLLFWSKNHNFWKFSEQKHNFISFSNKTLFLKIYFSENWSKMSFFGLKWTDFGQKCSI